MAAEPLWETLSEDKQLRLAIDLIQIALPIWNEYAENNLLTYRDTVVGMPHIVNKNLLNETINEIEKHLSGDIKPGDLKDTRSLLKLYSSFEDPVVALQDTDWELPYAVERMLYSVYNLLRSVLKAGVRISAISISINQAIDAIQNANILSEVQLRQILNSAINDK